MKGKSLIILEYLLLITYLALFHWNKSPFTLAVFVKTLLMPVLIVLLVINTARYNLLSIGTLLALIASTSGDLFMELNQLNDKFFLPGLGSFLLAHIFYIITFSYKLKINNIQNKNYTILAILLLTATALVALLWPHLGQMKIPVIIYALIITSVTYIAYLHCQQFTGKICAVFWGALIFLISDAALSITLFITQYPLHREANMILYVTGQTLIVLGILQTTKITENGK